MKRYQEAFAQCQAENRSAFIPFWMIGDPSPEQSQDLIETIAESADILELGLPFSDPLADGPTIQASVNRALQAGTNTEKCFKIIKNIRQKFPEKPIGLLVYLNLIIAHGIEEFFSDCQTAGVDSVLIPELPIEEVELVSGMAKARNIALVFLVSTNTPTERIKKICEASQGGFIYAVSTPSITGAKTDIAPETLTMIRELKAKTNIPICVGFGISSPEQVSQLAQHQADGIIIGSKLFSFIEAPAQLSQFCQDCREATKR